MKSPIPRTACTTFALFLIVSCGGSAATTVERQSDTTGAAPDTTSTAMSSTSTSSAAPGATAGTEGTAAEFPFPRPPGGTLGPAYPTEITVFFEASDYDSILAFYDDLASTQDGRHFDLFPDGDQWEFADARVRLTLEDNRSILYIRLN